MEFKPKKIGGNTIMINKKYDIIEQPNFRQDGRIKANEKHKLMQTFQHTSIDLGFIKATIISGVLT